MNAVYLYKGYNLYVECLFGVALLKILTPMIYHSKQKKSEELLLQHTLNRLWTQYKAKKKNFIITNEKMDGCFI